MGEGLRVRGMAVETLKQVQHEEITVKLLLFLYRTLIFLTICCQKLFVQLNHAAKIVYFLGGKFYNID